jgi:acetyl-CoA carboxylase biotin carboxyl carrier protein
MPPSRKNTGASSLRRGSKTKTKSKSLTKSKDENHRMHLSHLESVLDLMGKHEIAELEWANKDESLKLKTRHAIPAVIHSPSHQSSPYGFSNPAAIHPDRVAHSELEGRTQHTKSSVPPVVSVTTSNDKQILSPFVGTFYRSASPESDPYVREGQVIKRGDVLCIIEAMKLMNEIDAEFPGKIKSVLVENGQPVEFGEPLFTIEI